MLVRLEQRPEASKSMVYVSPLIAVVLTVLTAMVMFGMLGVDPIKAITTFFIEPVSSLDGLAELLVKATPLVLIGVGLSRLPYWFVGAGYEALEAGRMTMFGSHAVIRANHFDASHICYLHGFGMGEVAGARSETAAMNAD